MTLITLFIFTTNIGFSPKITAPPPPIPDQFIADIVPKNNNTDIQLLNFNAIITFNATDLFNEMKITFNGTYTLFNPENPTNLTIILPFSLDLDVINTTFGVFVNNTQVPFEIETVAEENLTATIENIDFIPESFFYSYYPITLIYSNLTLLENITYIVKYQFEGLIYESFSIEKLFYMVYTSNTDKFWKGIATRYVEYKTIGGNPIFFTIGPYEGLEQILDVPGGKRYISEWNNIQNFTIMIGIRFDGTTYEIYPYIVEIFALNILAYIAITIVTVVWIKRRKKKRF